MTAGPGERPMSGPGERPALSGVPTGPRTAVVVSGGGHLGAVQVGMFRALVESGIDADCYVGTSVGALNAAIMAACPPDEALERLETAWASLRTESIFGANSVRQAWKLARGHDHLHSNGGLIRLITSAVPVTHFHHLRVPLRVVACNLERGEEHVFAAGPLLRPLLASAALPGVFPPVRIGAENYVDGGIVDNVPVSHAEGADRIYVLAVSDIGDDLPTSSFGVLLRSFAISRATRFRIEREHLAQRAEVVVLPQPELPEVRFPDLSHSADLIRLGYEAAVGHLANLAALEQVQAGTRVS